MFENILHQDAAGRLAADINEGTLARSMLFRGPPLSGKGASALELARALSCTAAPGGKWNCACSSCAQHRALVHQDLLAAGPRQFQPEIAASASVLLSESGFTAGKTLFSRAVRRLLLRFSPILWDGETKAAKLNSIIEVLNDDLDALAVFEEAENAASGEKDAKTREKLEKLVNSIVKNAEKLENDEASRTALSREIQVFMIRNASSWLRISPLAGRNKTLILENAEAMNENARNALLKILEEPPETAYIVLTSAKYKTLLPTILSRVRPYDFVQRGKDAEGEVLTRALHAPGAASSLGEYFSGFEPVSGENIRGFSAFFAASIAKGAWKGAHPVYKDTLAEIGTRLKALCPSPPVSDTKTAVSQTLAATGDMKNRAVFEKFLAALLESLSSPPQARTPAWISLCASFRKRLGEAKNAVQLYNQSPSQALERLCFAVKTDLAL